MMSDQQFNWIPCSCGVLMPLFYAAVHRRCLSCRGERGGEGAARVQTMHGVTTWVVKEHYTSPTFYLGPSEMKRASR